MAVASIGTYKFPPRDRAEIYGASQLVYFCWERHMLFAAPFITFPRSDMKLGDYLENIIKPLISPDPDAPQVEWTKAQWSNGPKPFTPNIDASLVDNGLGHKAKLIMSTPGLNSLMPDS